MESCFHQDFLSGIYLYQVKTVLGGELEGVGGALQEAVLVVVRGEIFPHPTFFTDKAKHHL